MNLTKIEWTDFTWNVVTGCWGPGGTAEKPNRCAYCYAQGIAKRFNPFEKTGYVQLKMQCVNNDPFQPLFWPDRLSEPAKVKKPSRIFVCSMADLFGDWVPDEWIEAVLNRTQRADYSHHTFQFLTKNTKRLKDFNPWPKNCWIGATVTNQYDADERLPWLLQVDAPVLFVSVEPILGPVDMRHIKSPQYSRYLDALSGYYDNSPYECDIGNAVNWVICGAETGPRARPMHPDIPRTLRDQCQAAQIPFFFKAWGEWAPGSDASKKRLCVYNDGRTVEFTKEAILAEERRSGLDHNKFNPALMSRVGKKAAGRILDGKTWDEVPEING